MSSSDGGSTANGPGAVAVGFAFAAWLSIFFCSASAASKSRFLMRSANCLDMSLSLSCSICPVDDSGSPAEVLFTLVAFLAGASSAEDLGDNARLFSGCCCWRALEAAPFVSTSVARASAGGASVLGSMTVCSVPFDCSLGFSSVIPWCSCSATAPVSSPALLCLTCSVSPTACMSWRGRVPESFWTSSLDFSGLLLRAIWTILLATMDA